MKIESFFKQCPTCGGAVSVKNHEGNSNVVCKSCGLSIFISPAPCASALIHKDGKVLLTKRAHEPFKNKWEIPGGFVTGGESLEQAVSREIMEELGISLQNVAYLTSKPDIYECEGTTYETVSTYFICQYDGAVKKNAEILDWKFFSLDDLPEIGFKHQKEVLKSLRNENTKH